MREKKNLTASFPLISVNWHLWPRCLNKCKFCFGTFREIQSILSKDKALQIPSILKSAGTKKLSLTGGEPLLCPHLGDILIEAKNCDLTTMLITSGTLLSKRFINKYQAYIDWIALSVDSSDEITQFMLGRGTGNHIQKIKEIVKEIHKAGIHLKINTVVTRMNWEEDMSELILELNPKRWKIFQVLPIKGQNDEFIDSLKIASAEFDFFVEKHAYLTPISERNEDMKGSYIMLDALGRFFQNTKGYLEYSHSILNTDPSMALKSVGWNYINFKKRGGVYDWDFKSRGLN